MRALLGMALLALCLGIESLLKALDEDTKDSHE